MKPLTITAGALVLTLLWGHASVSAHEVRPAHLVMTGQSPRGVTIVWKQPVVGDRALRLVPTLSNRWLDLPPIQQEITDDYLVRIWSIEDAHLDELDGVSIAVEGLDQSITNVVISVERANGATVEWLLTPGEPSRVLRLTSVRLSVPLATLLALGFKQILDVKLLIGVVMLALLGPDYGRRRLGTVVTLLAVSSGCGSALVALEVVRFPVVVTSGLSALSLVCLAADRMGTATRVRSRTASEWIFAAVFGFLHGFGTSSPLAGLDPSAIPTRLPLFCGAFLIAQLIVVDGVLLLVERVGLRRAGSERWIQVAGYACGGVAAFQVLDRLIATVAL